MLHRVNITPKMLFINDKNMLFCDKKCGECPIKYICYTNDVVAFDIKINTRTKRLVECLPHPVNS